MGHFLKTELVVEARNDIHLSSDGKRWKRNAYAAVCVNFDVKRGIFVYHL